MALAMVAILLGIVIAQRAPKPAISD